VVARGGMGRTCRPSVEPRPLVLGGETEAGVGPSLTQRPSRTFFVLHMGAGAGWGSGSKLGSSPSSRVKSARAAGVPGGTWGRAGRRGPACNPSCWGGCRTEGRGSRPAWEDSLFAK
jgi:hypothetical protein